MEAFLQLHGGFQDLQFSKLWSLISQGQRWHQGSGYFGRTWQPGDVVGCMINLDDASMIFTLNGELLITNKGSELAFADYEIENGKSTISPSLPVPAP